MTNIIKGRYRENKGKKGLKTGFKDFKEDEKVKEPEPK